MKTIYIPVNVEDELPTTTDYYFTLDKGALKYFTREKEWWYDGVQFKPKKWLKPIQIPDNKFDELLK